MNLKTVLRQSYAGLGMTSCVYHAVDEHRLAGVAQRQEMAHGHILWPRAVATRLHVPYYAAQPVALQLGGLRKAGFAASMAWGASLAVSGMRTDLPLLSLYWMTGQRRAQLPQLPRRGVGAPRGDRPMALRLARYAAQMAPFAAFALGGWEALLGTGEGAPADLGRAHGDRYAATRWRRLGLMGRVEQHLCAAAQTASRRGLAGRELALLGAALGVRVALTPLRLAGAAFVAGVALLGVAVGICYELGAQAAYFAALVAARLRRTPVEVLSLQAAIRRQGGQQAEEVAALDDTALAAPLVDVLWRQPLDMHLLGPHPWMAHVPMMLAGDRHLGLQRLGLLPQWQERRRDDALHGILAQAVFRGWNVGRPAAGVPRVERWLRPVAPDAAPYAGGVDVHARGRDPAMRRSLANLLRRYPEVHVASALDRLQQEVARQSRARTALARRRHETGAPLLETVKVALQPERGGWGFPGILANGHAVRLDDGRNVALKTVCATVWYATEHLEDPRGEAPQHLALRQERQDALLVAIADCVNSFGHRVCGAGQAQRMLLVLQGCLEDVRIEDYEDAPTPAQMVTYLYGQISADLPEDASPAQVRARYDAAYREGTGRLPAAQHAALREGLSDLARMDWEIAWQPGAR